MDIKGFIKGYRSYNGRIRYLFLGIFTTVAALSLLMGFIGHYVRRGSWDMDAAAIKLVTGLRNEELTSIAKTFTYSGSLVPIVVVTLAVMGIFTYKKRRAEGLFFGGNVLGVWLFNGLLKVIFKRPRPEGFRLVDVGGYSFPSGHAMTSIGLALIATYFIILYVRRRTIAYILSALILICAIAIGLSRVYLGVHYLSDVVAGWAAGILWISTSIVIYKLVGYRRYRRQ